MTVAFVLGNGQSRLSIDPELLRAHGKIYGCNALYRNFIPDCLIATDRPIAERIQQSGYSKNHRFYTRRPISDLGAKVIPKKYFGNSSGPVATALAALDGSKTIYLLGFDMGPTASGKFNNVYADTEFYRSSKDSPTYIGNWVKQLQTVSKDFGQTVFYRVKGSTTAAIPELQSLPNFKTISIEDFKGRFNLDC